MPRVTAQDQAQAERILKILGSRPTPAKVKALAQEVAFLHESAVACAFVRLERQLERLGPEHITLSEDGRIAKIVLAEKSTPQPGNGEGSG